MGEERILPLAISPHDIYKIDDHLRVKKSTKTDWISILIYKNIVEQFNNIFYSFSHIMTSRLQRPTAHSGTGTERSQVDRLGNVRHVATDVKGDVLYISLLHRIKSFDLDLFSFFSQNESGLHQHNDIDMTMLVQLPLQTGTSLLDFCILSQLSETVEGALKMRLFQ